MSVDRDYVNTWVFQAKNGAEASHLALGLVNRETSTNEGKYIKALVEYNLYRISRNGNGEGETVPFPTMETDIFQKHIKWQESQALEAYHGARFGMKMREVLSLPHFRNYSISSQRLEAREKIGSDYYDITLVFNYENGGLSNVYIDAPFRMASQLNTLIARDIEKLHDYVKGENGETEINFGIPGLELLNKQSNQVVYRWVFMKHDSLGFNSYGMRNDGATKLIELAVTENLDGDNTYRAFVSIFLDRIGSDYDF